MGNTCKPMAVSFQCMTKFTTNKKKKIKKKKKDWLDLLVVQGILKSLPQHHSLKASVLQCLPFYCPPLISMHDYWKKHSFDYTDLCRQSNVSAFLYTI